MATAFPPSLTDLDKTLPLCLQMIHMMVWYALREHTLWWDWRFGGAFVVRIELSAFPWLEIESPSPKKDEQVLDPAGRGESRRLTTGPEIACVSHVPQPLIQLFRPLQAMMTLSIFKFLITLCLADGPVNGKPSATFWYFMLYIPYTGFLNFLHVRPPPPSPRRPCPAPAPLAESIALPMPGLDSGVRGKSSNASKSRQNVSVKHVPVRMRWSEPHASCQI